MNKSTRKVLKDLALWLIALPVTAGLFTAAVNLFLTPSKVGIKFTPDHFGSPSLPLSPLKLLGGVSESFGILSAILLVPLLLLFFYILIVSLREFREWSASADAPAGPPADASAPEYLNLTLSPGTRVTAVKWGAALVVIVVAVRILFTQPLVQDVSTPGKFLLAGKFLASFNAGLIKKSSFNEEEYTYLMLDALKFDRDEYMAFAESKYWAYFASKGITTNTERDKASAKDLIRLFDESLLHEDSLEQAAAVMKKAGETAAAEAVLEKLRNSQ